MSETLNWVERRHRAEGNLSRSKPSIWRDVCNAVTDAARSFNELYGGKAEVNTVNGHRCRVVLEGNSKREIDLDFDDANSRINVSCVGSPWGSKSYQIEADHNSAFIVDAKRNRLGSEELSEDILSPYFFPRP
jgi:hypothetical protein